MSNIRRTRNNAVKIILGLGGGGRTTLEELEAYCQALRADDAPDDTFVSVKLEGPMRLEADVDLSRASA